MAESRQVVVGYGVIVGGLRKHEVCVGLFVLLLFLCCTLSGRGHSPGLYLTLTLAPTFNGISRILRKFFKKKSHQHVESLFDTGQCVNSKKHCPFFMSLSSSLFVRAC